MIEGKSQVLGVMETGEIFGEIGLLQGLKTTASVIADDDEVEIYVVEGSILRILFFRIPALTGRWFKYLTFVLSRRLKDREKSQGNQNK